MGRTFPPTVDTGFDSSFPNVTTAAGVEAPPAPVGIIDQEFVQVLPASVSEGLTSGRTIYQHVPLNKAKVPQPAIRRDWVLLVEDATAGDTSSEVLSNTSSLPTGITIAVGAADTSSWHSHVHCITGMGSAGPEDRTVTCIALQGRDPEDRMAKSSLDGYAPDGDDGTAAQVRRAGLEQSGSHSVSGRTAPAR